MYHAAMDTTASVCFSFTKKESPLTDSFVERLSNHRTIYSICYFSEAFETSCIHMTVSEIQNVCVHKQLANTCHPPHDLVGGRTKCL